MSPFKAVAVLCLWGVSSTGFAQGSEPLRPLSVDRPFVGKLLPDPFSRPGSRVTTAVFHFTARPAERVVIELKVRGPRAANVNAKVRLGDWEDSTLVPSLYQILPDTDAKDGEIDSEVRTRLFAGGDYYLHLELTEVIDYEVRLRTGFSSGRLKTGTLRPGATARGTFTAADALNDKGGFGEWLETYRFTGTEKQKVSISMQGDVHVDLFDEERNQVAGKYDAQQRFVAELPSAGNYVLEVHGLLAPMAYSLGFDVAAPVILGDEGLQTPPLYPSRPVRGLFDNVDAGPEASVSQTVVRRFLVDGKAKQRVKVTVRAVDAVAHLVLRQRLVQKDGKAVKWRVLAADHDDVGEGNAQLEAVLPVDGAYFLDVIGERVPGKTEAPYVLEMNVTEGTP